MRLEIIKRVLGTCTRQLWPQIALLSSRRFHCKDISNMNSLETVIAKLKKLAPLQLAGNWDNVGLLVEPSRPKFVSKVMLTNDLTLQVMEEAKEETVDLIVSYHPPIFAPLKRLTQGSWKERFVVDCMENRIAVFSPHTSHDAVAGGVNDWLMSAFDIKPESLRPVEPSEDFPGGSTHILEVTLTDAARVKVIRDLCLVSQLPQDSRLRSNRDAFIVHSVRTSGGEEWKLRVECDKDELTSMLKGLTLSDCPERFQVLQLSQSPLPGTGMGRWAELSTAITLSEAVSQVKSHVGLEHVMVAHRQDQEKRDESIEERDIHTVAVCAGSGKSVLSGQAAKADLFLTGEMSHHEVLDAVHRGSHVILTQHSNSERGYLHVLKKKMSTALGPSIHVFVSSSDRDPLQIV